MFFVLTVVRSTSEEIVSSSLSVGVVSIGVTPPPLSFGSPEKEGLREELHATHLGFRILGGRHIEWYPNRWTRFPIDFVRDFTFLSIWESI